MHFSSFSRVHLGQTSLDWSSIKAREPDLVRYLTIPFELYTHFCVVTEANKCYQKRQYNRFIERLYELVNDETTDHLIRWNGDGEEEGFTIIDPFKLEEDIINKHFMLKDLKSFIRQLNMYDFRIKNKRQKCLSRVFYNPNFKRND